MLIGCPRGAGEGAADGRGLGSAQGEGWCHLHRGRECRVSGDLRVGVDSQQEHGRGRLERGAKKDRTERAGEALGEARELMLVLRAEGFQETLPPGPGCRTAQMAALGSLNSAVGACGPCRCQGQHWEGPCGCQGQHCGLMGRAVQMTGPASGGCCPCPPSGPAVKGCSMDTPFKRPLGTGTWDPPHPAHSHSGKPCPTSDLASPHL